MRAIILPLFAPLLSAIQTNLLAEEVQVTRQLIALYEQKIALLQENPALNSADVDLLGKSF